jgi:hypothetical protein
MTNYKNGKIYKIVDLTNGNIYIGSTKNKLSVRLSGHKTENKCKPEKNISSGIILKNNNFKIELIENYPCDTKRELEMREQYFLDNLECVNTNKAFETREQNLIRHREYDNRRTRDHKPYLRRYREYRVSWGGDARSNNNLLSIDISLFQ